MKQFCTIVQSPGELPDLSGEYALILDTETSGFLPGHGDRPCGISIGPLKRPAAWYVPVAHTIAASDEEVGKYIGADPYLRGREFVNVPWQEVRVWLKALFEDPNHLWIFQNAKFDLNMLRAFNLVCKGEIFDTMVAAHVHRGNLASYSLDYLTRMFVPGFAHVWYDRVMKYLEATQEGVSKTAEGKVFKNYSLVPIQLLGPYAMEDIHATRLVYVHLAEVTENYEVKAKNQGFPSHDRFDLLKADFELARVIADMEHRGIDIDVARAVELRDRNEELVEEYADQIYDLVGSYFNIGSWKQRWTALEAVGGEVKYWMKPEGKHQKKYPHLLPTEFRGKQKSDQYTTVRGKSSGRPCWNSAALLEYLAIFRKEKNRPAFDFIRLYREVDTRSRLVNAYLKAYIRGADHNGRLHGSFNQTGTITGRLSASNPNLQNVAKVKGNADLKAWEDFFGEEEHGPEEESLARQLRSVFLPRPGQVLVSIDYSQIEYRLAAYFSNDPIVARWYREDPNTDYHQATSDLCGVSRDQAKVVNFGVLYGMGARSLAKLLSVPEIEGKDLLERIFVARPALRRMINDVSEIAGRMGLIRNPFGRVVPVPKDGLYKALNYLVQGTAGDMMRRAMIRVDRYIREKKLPIALLLQVHDELLFSMPKELVEKWAPVLGEVMCHFPEIGIPITYDIEVGPDWGHQIPLKDWIDAHKNCEKTLAKS